MWHIASGSQQVKEKFDCIRVTRCLSSSFFPLHSIFFNYFFNFLNHNTISLNLNHLYHFEIRKAKLFYFGMEWNVCNEVPKQAQE